MKRIGLLAFCVSLVAVFTLGCGQQASEVATSTTTTSATTTTTTLPGGGATITGQVAIAASDLVGAGASSFAIVAPKFRTLANTGVSGAAVTLYEIKADGTEVNTGKTATTDASGNYTLSGVTPLTSGVHKIVAEKTVGSDKVQVSTLAVVTSAASQTANVAPETHIATRMFDDVIKDQFSTLIVNQSTMKELKNLVVDDTETFVNNGKFVLPSMKTAKQTQVDFVAAGIGEDNGNAENALKKLKLENLAYNASREGDIVKAAKFINELVINGAGPSYLLPGETTRALAKAYINGNEKTAAEVISAVNDSLSGGFPLNSTQVISGFDSHLKNLQTKIEEVAAGTADHLITGDAYLAFDENERSAGLTSSTLLDVPEQVALKNYINASISEVLFIDRLGYASGAGISTTEASFENTNLYYGYYGGLKVVGDAQVRLPNTNAFQGVTASKVELFSGEVVVGTMTKETSTRFRFDSNSGNAGPTLTAGNTYHYTLKATLSNSSTVTFPVTLEAVEIPGTKISRPDGTEITSPNATDYYALATLSDKKPIIVWSTSEAAGTTLPSGFSWAYFVEILRYGTKAGATTLEVDEGDATGIYTSGTDLAYLLTNSSFIFPVEISGEVSGEKVAYRLYLQRVLLNAEGKFNGIAAGHFERVRYAP